MKMCDLRMQVLQMKLERAEDDPYGEREAEFEEEMRPWAVAPPAAVYDLRGPLPPAPPPRQLPDGSWVGSRLPQLPSPPPSPPL